MKKQTGIWIDGTKAVLVTLNNGNESIREVDSDVEHRSAPDEEGDKGTFMGSSHLSQERKFDERKKQQLDWFIQEVIDMVKHDDELYVFGPAETKIRLKQRIDEEHGMAKKLKACETSDSMTQNQMVAKVKEFFKP